MSSPSPAPSERPADATDSVLAFSTELLDALLQRCARTGEAPTAVIELALRAELARMP